MSWLGSAVGKDDVHCNARRRRRIRSGSNPTSVMKKCMNYISGMVVKMGISCITDGKIILHRMFCK